MPESERTAQLLRTLAASGSFTAAAKRLGVSQPTLSQSVRRLEADWGVELVERGSRPLRLTEAGTLIAETERRIAELRSDCRRAVADLAQGVRGRVSIGVSEYREAFFLTEVLPIFRARYPDVELYLEEGMTRELERFVLEGRTDVSIGILPLAAEGGRLDVVPLYEERLLLVMSAALAADMGLAGESADFRRFDAKPFIIVKTGQRLHELFERLCQETSSRPKVVLESESLASALALCEAGLGATIVTDSLYAAAECERPGRLRAFEIKPDVPPRTAAAILRKDRYAPKAAKALVAVMKEAAERLRAARREPDQSK